MSYAEILSSGSALNFHSPTFPKLLPFLLSQNRCFIQMEQNIYLKSIVVEMTKPGSGEDQLGNPSSFILWMTKPWPRKERSSQDQSQVSSSLCNPIHSPPIHVSRWRAQKWDLFCPIHRDKKKPSNIIMEHSEGEEDRSWKPVPFKQKWKCFPTFPIPTSHVCWNWRSALPPFLSLLASLLTHTKNYESRAMTPGYEPILLDT